MISLALKNIWHRRSRYGWLFIELIAVTFISWYVLDRLIVLTYQYNEPVGYDRDRMCIVTTGVTNVPHGEVKTPIENMESDFLGFLGQIREIPQVESATPVIDQEFMDGRFRSLNLLKLPDNSYVYQVGVRYISGQDFFKTFGITTDSGEEGIEYLSNIEGDGFACVKTRSLALVEFKGKNPMAVTDSLYEAALAKNSDAPIWEKPQRVLGIVDDVKPKSTVSGAYWINFHPMMSSELGSGSWSVAIRLKPDVNVKSFVTEMKNKLKDLHFGKVTALNVRSYDDISEEFQNRESGPVRRLDLIFALFFLFNVCLGVIGTFWMMTRKRSEEVGVLRAYGSSRWGILSLLINEAVILTIIAWIIGCLLWFYYALDAGLFMGEIMSGGLVKSWVESFPLHFAIVSGIILVLLLLAVLIGVAGPGYKLSRVEPVDALRDE